MELRCGHFPDALPVRCECKATANYFSLLLAILTPFLVAACGFTKGKEAAQNAVENFHLQYNENRLSEIYSGSTPGYKGSVSETDHLKLFRAIRQKLGSFQRGSEAGWNVFSGTRGTSVSLRYQSQFERGTATESFNFQISDDMATLQGYNINSRDLIIDTLTAPSTPVAATAADTSTKPAKPTIPSAPSVPSFQSTTYATAEEAQREAVRRYPDLGIAGSRMNRDFVARHKRYQSESPEKLIDPSWPLRLAEESARAVKGQ